MNKLFSTFTIPTSNRYGLNSIPYKVNQRWNLLPENFKLSPSSTPFKNEKDCGNDLFAQSDLFTYLRAMFQT